MVDTVLGRRECSEKGVPVSYTHLDVYKRQLQVRGKEEHGRGSKCFRIQEVGFYPCLLYTSSRFPIGTVIKGQVRNLTPYGAFVGLEDGIDGMIPVSDMSWTRKINHPSDVLTKGDEVEAIVLDIKKEDQRVSLGIKQLESDPWESINDRFKAVSYTHLVGDQIEVLLERLENDEGIVVLSKEKAAHKQNWDKICLLYTSMLSSWKGGQPRQEISVLLWMPVFP